MNGRRESLDDHVSGIADRLRRSWAGMPFYLDMPWFGEDETLEDGTVAIGHVLRKCAENNLGAIPVVRTSSSEDYLKAVRSYLAELEGSFCLRLVEADFDEEGGAGIRPRAWHASSRPSASTTWPPRT